MSVASRRAIAAWLLACAALVLAMVVVGGVTRLTHSGLSIVEWQPLVGTLPPLGDSAWQELFAKYRETPEFRLVNHDMTLEGFKQIFWWEYAHRLLGRIVGIVFLAPFLWFLLRRRVDASLAWKLAGVLALGSLQGLLGWYMVQSGLVDDPRVSHFRLTAHLGVALAIFAAELWIALGLLGAPAAPRAPGLSRLAKLALGLVALVFAQALAGGFVAGLRAGLAYNSFPLMNGALVPPEWLLLDPWPLNFLYNMATVQLVHRTLAWLLVLLVPLLWWRLHVAAAPARAQSASTALLAMVFVQFALGVATLLTRVALPLAALHQAGAVLLLAAALWTAQTLQGSTAAARSSPHVRPRGRAAARS